MFEAGKKNKPSPFNSTHYAKIYPQHGDVYYRDHRFCDVTSPYPHGKSNLEVRNSLVADFHAAVNIMQSASLYC